MSLRDKILKARDGDIREIEIPEWGGKDGDYFVKTFTNAEASNFSELLKDDDNDALLVKTIIMGLCDKDGVAILSAEDAAGLSSKNSKVATRVWNEIVSQNKAEVTEEDIKN